ncbi:MAG: hypothetical protein O3A36_03100 [bacterium]|nr:hypothetical protein [bacterium]
MNKMQLLRYSAGAICILLGGLVFFVHTDRQFINLTPGEGAGLLQTIRSEEVYEQTFQTRGQTISKIGAYLVPVNANAKTSQAVITISLFAGADQIATADIPVSLINNSGPSFVRLDVPSNKNEDITLRISALPDAHGLIALQKRQFDETFSQQTILFTIDGEKQDYAIGYTVYENIWPPFVQQLGGILVCAGLVLVMWNLVQQARNMTSILLLLYIALLYAAPSLKTYPSFFPAVAILIVAFWAVLRISGRTTIAATFGAFVFVCSTWLPLYFITNGTAEGILSVRDALIDPNQISVSHGGGGYVGISGALFAVVGICIWIYRLATRKLVVTQLDSAVAFLFVVSFYITFIPSPIHHYKAIILVVGCIAWFASLSFDSMQRFLGLRDMFVQTLLVLLLAIFLLDFMNITARTFAYGIGI